MYWFLLGKLIKMRLRFSFHPVVNYLRENVAAFKVIVMQIVSKLAEKIHSIINIFYKVYIPFLNIKKNENQPLNPLWSILCIVEKIFSAVV